MILLNNGSDISLIVNLLNGYFYVGAYAEIAKLQKMVEKIINKKECDPISVAEIKCIFGAGCQRLAKFQEAIDHYKEAKRIYENHGGYDWAVQVLKNNIATATGAKDKMIQEQCKVSGSQLMVEACQEREEIGKKLAITTAKHALAVFCYLQNSALRKAKKLTEEALKIRVEYYGQLHPSTVSSRINLGTFCLLEKSLIEKGIAKPDIILFNPPISVNNSPYRLHI